MRSSTVKRALGFQALTVSSSAVGFTKPVGASFALIRSETADVRWRDDGTNPTATVGALLAANESLEYDGPLDAIKFIRTGGTDATLGIHYYDVP